MNAQVIRARKGLDLPIEGRPDMSISTGRRVRSVALLGRDYLGLKPRMSVQPGDRVALGDPLFIDKRDPDVIYASPGSGTVSAVNRGERRALLSVVIDLESEDVVESPAVTGDPVSSMTVDEIRSALQRTGFWTAFRTRPFSRVPHSSTAPRSIFVTAIDTNPLAADPNIVVARSPEAFDLGLTVVSRLTEGETFLCTGENWPIECSGERLRHAVFAGPHPAGLVGTHIHHLDPVGADRTVWHIGYQDVMAIGVLFAEGRISTDRVIAIGGAAAENPRLVETRIGASIDELMAGETRAVDGFGESPRLVSGSVLSGREATTGEAFLGRYHIQVSAVPSGNGQRTLGWLPMRGGGYSFSGLFASRQGSRPRPFTTGSHGRATAMLPVNAFDDLIPMDVLATPLLKALLIKDTDQAQALGCLELDAEDLALCSFVCPGKSDYGAVLQANLDHIEREG